MLWVAGAVPHVATSCSAHDLTLSKFLQVAPSTQHSTAHQPRAQHINVVHAVLTGSLQHDWVSRLAGHTECVYVLTNATIGMSTAC